MRMKRVVLMSLVVMFAFAATATASLTDGLVAYYPFNGNANDESSNGNNGTVNGATLTTDRFGSANKAYSFNGTSNYISGSLNMDESTNNITISAWAKIEGSANNPYPRVIDFLPSKFWIWFDIDTNKYMFAGVDSTSSTGYYANAPTGHLNVWTHFAGIYNNATKQLSLYVNGELAESVSADITMQNMHTFIIGDNAEIYIRKFPGKIDDIRIYNRVLSEDEIQELYLESTEPDINVDPQQYDFGDLEVGRPRTMFLTISNSGGNDLVVNDIHMKYLISGNPFTFALPKAPPITVAPNAAVEVEVAYSPTFLYAMQSNTLVIGSNDSDEEIIEIPLQGQGIVAATSSQAVAQILYYIDYAIGHGLIVGEGNGNSPEKRINALKNMIKSAGDLIDNGDITAACEQLGSILKKVDGQLNPPDFISGLGTPGVAGGISGMMTNLGCN